MSGKPPDDKRVVLEFVNYLRMNGHPGLKVDRFPDDENRVSADVDAIAGMFAIEHTSIDTIFEQRQNSDWFVKAIGELEAELSANLTCRLRITIPYDGIRKGQNWSIIRQAFRSFIINESPGLPDGQHVIQNQLDIPFDFHVIKASNRRPGLFFCRFAPDDDSLPSRIREQFERKAKKLAQYKRNGKTTILLVESGDIALMNAQIMLDAIRVAYGGKLPKGIDHIWYVDTSISSDPSDFEFWGFTQMLQGQ
jgi:hypothetical protein